MDSSKENRDFARSQNKTREIDGGDRIRRDSISMCTENWLNDRRQRIEIMRKFSEWLKWSNKSVSGVGIKSDPFCNNRQLYR